MASLHLAQQILDIIWPVGSIYLSDNATNPNTKFGGTWVRLKGGFVYGSTLASGSTYSTGNGSGTTTNNHTLTIDEIPAHNHSGAQDETAGYYLRSGGSGGIQAGAGSSQPWHGWNWYSYVKSQGGGKGHHHPIPFIACSIWRRIK